MMERLQSRGYQTHGVGKMHFSPDPWRNWGFESRDTSEEIQPIDSERDDFCAFLREHGFDHVKEPHGIRSEMYYLPQPSQLPAELHNTSWVAERSLDFLQRRDKTRPFFLWTSFIKPHPPFEVPTSWDKCYRASEMLPPKRPEGFEQLLSYWNHFQNRYKYRDKGYDEMLLRTMKASYYACISFIDHQIGRLLDALGAERDHTLIIFTSDHGELLGDYGSFGKRSMLDAAARVPMIVRYPQHFEAGVSCDRPSTLLDIWPTCLALTNDPDPQLNAEGQNLADVATGRTERDTVYSQYSAGATGLYAAISSDLKYIYSAADQREWLFDLLCDPAETHNFAANPSYQERQDRLKQRLIRRFQADGYDTPLEQSDWRKFGLVKLPPEPDALLLFQDP
jgi:arylsulfatase A-like enzyme